jgi:YVTN family beta-propeller protein
MNYALGWRYLAGATLFALALIRLPSAGAQNFAVQSTIRVGSVPQSAAISHDGSRLFVANFGGDNISVIATQNGEVLKSIPVGQVPRGVILSRDGRRGYVLVTVSGSDDCGDADTEREITVNVVVIDTAALTIVQRIPLKGRTDALALTPDGRRLYVARVCHEVDFIDLTSADLQPHPSPGKMGDHHGYPVGILIAPDGNHIFVNYQDGGPALPRLESYTPAHDALVEYDLSSGGIVKMGHSLPNVGDQIALSPDGTQLWSNGADACSRPDYPHDGCPSVPSRVVNALRVSDDPNLTLTPLKTFGFKLDEFNGRISISPQGEVFVGGGIYLKRIDPRTLKVVQLLNIAAAGDVVFSPDGRTAYVTVGEMNQVDVLSRSKPGNPEVQSEAAALPITMVESVLLKQNCRHGDPCDVCANSNSNCTADNTPTEVPASRVYAEVAERGIVNPPGKRPYHPSKDDELACGLINPNDVPDGRLPSVTAERFLRFITRNDHYSLTAFNGEARPASSVSQPIGARSPETPELDRFAQSLGEDTVYLVTTVCHDFVRTIMFLPSDPSGTIIDSARDKRGKRLSLEKDKSGKLITPKDHVQTLVADFQAELRNPCSTLDDIKVTGNALYQVMFPPLVLQAMQALNRRVPHLTLAWNLRDQLRYIPVGALWDGTEFLVQTHVTPAEMAGTDWSNNLKGGFTGLAAGDSNPGRKYKDLPELHNVSKEITESFRNIPRIILLDNGHPPDEEAFTPKNFESQLRALEETQPRMRRIVHIASHFVLKDTANDTFLLTSSGPLKFTELTKYSFKYIWLVTLSACETGVSVSTGDVMQFQSFADLVSSHGAHAVMATLWTVDDQSTSSLMQAFYHSLESSVPKGEALRDAQLSLLNNHDTLSWVYTPPGSTKACKLAYDHPYYWAPFILIGDWN